MHLLSITLGLFPTPTIAASQTIRVPEDFETIQAAVDAANPGDTILVAAGTYYECVVVNKSVTLMGDESLNTIIDNFGGNAFVLKHVSNVVISRFKIRNTGRGIYLRNSTNCVINGNVITKNGPGPSITLEYSDGNVISNNTILDGGGRSPGICPAYSNKNVLTKNRIINNLYGILFGVSTGNIISGNEIRENDYGMVLYAYAYNNTFYHNNSISNTYQTYIGENKTNIWNCGYPYGGNYWSDYNGADLYCGPYQNVNGSDGIGDTPYVIDEHNRDGYPLANPWVPKVYGDINSDGVTDIFDLTTAATAFASKPGYPNWNPDADVYTDQTIDIFDFVIIAVNYGKTAEDP